MVGKLSISIGLCAVIFNTDIINDTRGKTTVIHKDRHHSADIWNNLANGRMLDNNPYGQPATKSFANLKHKLDKDFEINNLMTDIDG